MAREQNLINIEKALKEFYLPLWKNQLTTEASIIMSKVKKKTLQSNKIVASAPIGLAGGFGFGSEGMETPDPGAVNFERFNANAKDMYCDVAISVKATKLTGTNGSMADALQTEVKGAYEAAKWNVGRALFGNGQGILASISALGAAGNVITVDNTRNIMEGLIIDIYATGGTVPAVAGRRITAVDRVGNKITIDGAASTFAAGFITLQKSFKREITGLGAIFDNSITSLYGVDKATNVWLKPTEQDASAGIDDTLLTQTLRQAQRYKNSKVDMLLCGDDAYDSYVEYLKQTNQRIESNYELVGGFKAIKLIFSNREVLVANEQFIPTREMWGFETGDLEFHSFDWFFAELQGGGIFNLMEKQSVYRALLCNYGELICSNPGGCVRIYNVPALAM
jgi:hypothetical protein